MTREIRGASITGTASGPRRAESTQAEPSLHLVDRERPEDDLVLGSRPADDRDRVDRKVERPREEADDHAVRLPTLRRCVDGDLEGAPVDPDDLRSSRARLDAETQTRPAVDGGQRQSSDVHLRVETG